MKLVTDFESWKIQINNQFPTAKEAWDAQEKTINDLRSKLIIAGQTLKRARATINDLKSFTEENLKIMHDIELEKEKLERELYGRQTER